MVDSIINLLGIGEEYIPLVIPFACALVFLFTMQITWFIKSVLGIRG